MRPSPVVSFLLTLPFVVYAQAPPDSAKTYELDPIVVTATQIEALRSSVPNSVSILSQEDIRSGGETSLLSLINKRVPGLFVTERGVLGYGASDGAAGNISIRGSGGSPNTEVLVLTDGRPQMMGLFGHPLPDTYVTSGVERVEVIRGPASLMYGTNAMGGVINIISDKGVGTYAGAAYGSFNTEKLEVGTGYGFGGGGISVTANHEGTDGHRPSSDFKLNTGSIRGNVSLSPHYSFSADARVTRFRSYDPGPASAPVVDHWVDITRGSSGFALEDRFENVQGALKAFFNFGVHDIYDGFHSTDNNLGLLLYQEFTLFPGSLFTAGIDYMRYGGRAENTAFAADFGEHFVNELGAYVLVQQQFAGRLTANAGVRYNRHSLYGGTAVPQLGLAFRATGATTIKASASRGFRSPTIRELYLFPAPTPTLRPETMWSYDLGVLQTIGQIASVELTGFLTEGDNMIRTTGYFPDLTLDNSGHFTHRGLEFSGTVTPVLELSMDLTYGFLVPGQETAANPRHKLYLGGMYRWNPLVLSLGIQYVAGLYGDDAGREPLSDYALLSARASWAISDVFSVYAAGENLLDREYQILYDYPMPGRTLIAGINWTAR